MSYKDELLKFLYNSSSGRAEIHPITDNSGFSNKEVNETISDLKKDNIIDTDDKYRQIGCGDPKRLMTSKILKITARLTPLGQKYVQETYFKEENEKTFSTNQIVYVNGDNSGQIAQTDNQSSSRLEERKCSATKNPHPKTLIQMLLSKKTIIAIIIAVIAGLFLFLLIGNKD
jgi:hypothetical protein